MYGKDVFISHHQSDSVAKDLKAQLNLIGIYPFYSTDDLHAGDDLPLEIENAIRNCKLFVLVQTFDKASKWIRKEVNLAVALDKPLIRVCANTTKLPVGLGLDFAELRRIDAIPPDEENLKAAAEEIGNELERVNKQQMSQILSRLTPEKRKPWSLHGILIAFAIAILLVWILQPKQIDPDCEFRKDTGTLIVKEFPYRAAMRDFTQETPPKWSSYADKIRHAVILGNITTIGNHAFDGCANLETVTMNGEIMSIGKSAFHACEKLKKMKGAEAPEDVESVINPDETPKENFDIVIPDGVRTIKDGAFSGCNSMNSVYIPDSVTKIQQLAFTNCENLADVKMSQNVASLGKNLFEGCHALTSITIPLNITSIPSSFCASCWALVEVRILGKVTEIGESAFSTCKSLPEISLPDSVTKIGDRAFKNCTHLNTITIPLSVEEIGEEAFHECHKFDKISIPDSVIKIGKGAFSACTHLTEIILPPTFLKNANAFPYDNATFTFRSIAKAAPEMESQTPPEPVTESDAASETETQTPPETVTEPETEIPLEPAA